MAGIASEGKRTLENLDFVVYPMGGENAVQPFGWVLAGLATATFENPPASRDARLAKAAWV